MNKQKSKKQTTKNKQTKPQNKNKFGWIKKNYQNNPKPFKASAISETDEIGKDWIKIALVPLQ